MDEVDEKLLALLEANARRSTVALARAVGLSRSSVQERLAKLEDAGHIAGYTIIRGGIASGRSVQALLFLQISVRPCAVVLDVIGSWPAIRQCWSLAGETDAVVLAEVADMAALEALRERMEGVKGIAAIRTAPILRTLANRPLS